MEILLPKPLPMNMSLTDVLTRRRTNRNVLNKPLPDDVLSTLLWACAGITDKDGRRVVPSTLDLRAVDAYVLRDDGAFHYDAAQNQLVQTTDKDVRKDSTAYQFEFVETAPVTIVFVADKERAKTARAGATLVDSGTMGQCAYLAMTALGLAGTIRASFDHEVLRESMELPEHLEPILLFTVGYPQ